MNFSRNFTSFSVQQGCTTNPAGCGGHHLGLVMAKLAEINFNLGRAIECTWPRTLRDGRRVLLWPLLPQIGPTGWLVCATFMSALLCSALLCDFSHNKVVINTCLQQMDVFELFYTEHSLDFLMVRRKTDKLWGETKSLFLFSEVWNESRCRFKLCCVVRKVKSGTDKLNSASYINE